MIMIFLDLNNVLLKIVIGDSEEDEIFMNELKALLTPSKNKAGNNVNIINGVGTDPFRIQTFCYCY